ncbi:MAG: hypothetical protein Q9163_000167 [Psora crenata]
MSHQNPLRYAEQRQLAFSSQKLSNANTVVSLNRSLRTPTHARRAHTSSQPKAGVVHPPPNIQSNRNIMEDLTARFGALSLHDPPKTEADHINDGNWPWAPRLTSCIDVSQARYEANLLTLLKDFALKARHEYARTKKWPSHETENSALVLEYKAQRMFAHGVREREVYEEGNYLEELDWYWRYWGVERKAYQQVWDYVVRGDVGRKGTVYSAGMTMAARGQKEWQKGVEF